LTTPVGVDTHKYVHVAVALDDIGGVIESRSFVADTSGYDQLIDWAVGLARASPSGSRAQDFTRRISRQRSAAGALESLRSYGPTVAIAG